MAGRVWSPYGSKCFSRLAKSEHPGRHFLVQLRNLVIHKIFPLVAQAALIVILYHEDLSWTRFSYYTHSSVLSCARCSRVATGLDYTGSKACDSGLTCVYVNDFYSQYQKGSGD